MISQNLPESDLIALALQRIQGADEASLARLSAKDRDFLVALLARHIRHLGAKRDRFLADLRLSLFQS
jgi:hypothetical protein